MAAAEARTAWQRMANRCIVQEDAKRAPKLAYYPSSTSLFHPDPTSEAAANKADQSPSTFLPPSFNPTDPNPLPSELKWWLHVQPNLGAKEVDPLTVDPLAIDSDGPIMEDGLKAQSEAGFFASCKNVDPLTPFEPWWRISDADELAMFVAQRSTEHVENCDLPPPREINFYADCGVVWPDHRELYASDPIRAELLDALRRSQTRAREAEMAAQRAHIEKERVVDLFFKQASSLFAYRQWVQMLQLESFCLRSRIRSPRSKSTPTAKKRGLGLCEYAVVAVSVGLAAAGVLFGWSLGWWLPIF